MPFDETREQSDDVGTYASSFIVNCKGGSNNIMELLDIIVYM